MRRTDNIEEMVAERFEEFLNKHNALILEHIPLDKIVEEMQNALADIHNDMYGIDCTMTYVKILAEAVIGEGY